MEKIHLFGGAAGKAGGPLLNRVDFAGIVERLGENKLRAIISKEGGQTAMKYVVGVDVGGTTIKIAIFDQPGKSSVSAKLQPGPRIKEHPFFPILPLRSKADRET